jgi:hypothetical protein
VGASFTILSFASHTDYFEQYEGLDLGDGRLLSPSVLATQFKLTAS